jgi:methyl-accepting chemotaxis protein
MTKLNYPSHGLMSFDLKAIIVDCHRSISDAKANSNLDVPHRYSRRDYLKSLDDKINDYQNRLEEIMKEIESADRDFSDFSDASSRTIKQIKKPKIDKRIRRIL